MRLEGKIAIFIAAGQGRQQGEGNGRAAMLRFAQEGVKIMAVDAIFLGEETASMVKQEGSACVAFLFR
jgi:hypothetical protein